VPTDLFFYAGRPPGRAGWNGCIYGGGRTSQSAFTSLRNELHINFTKVQSSKNYIPVYPCTVSAVQVDDVSEVTPTTHLDVDLEFEDPILLSERKIPQP
jgi:hypothetical protein